MPAVIMMTPRPLPQSSAVAVACTTVRKVPTLVIALSVDQCTLLRRLLWRCLSYGLGTLLLCITLPLLGCLASACE
jgi:hypothetical protein